MNSFLEALHSQEQGQLSFTVLIVMVAILGIVLYRHVPNRKRWYVHFGLIVVFLSSLLFSARDQAAYFPIVGFVGLFVWLWRREMKLSRLRLPPWLLIVAVALIFRVPGMNDSLWYDESFTAALARLPFDRMNIVNLYDVHPPIWYFIEHLTVRIFGASEIALRLPSLVFGVYSCVLVYELAGQFASKRAALFAGLFTAMLPAHIYYGHEARGYTLLLCCVLQMMLSTMKGRGRDFVLLSYIVPMVHSLGLIYLPFVGLWGLMNKRIKRGTLILGAVAALPAFVLALVQSRDVADGFWLNDLTPTGLIAPLYRMTLMVIPSNYIPLFAAVIVGATAIALYVNRRRLRQAQYVLLLLTLFGVPASLGVLSFAWHNVYLDRAMLPAAAMLPILWATLFDRLQHGQQLVARAIVLPTVMIAGLVTPSNKKDVRLMADICAGTDMTYTTSVSAAFVAQYYVGAPVLWPGAGDLNQSLPAVALDALGWPRIDFDDLPAGRVCVIDGYTPLSTPAERAYMASIARKATTSISINEHMFGSIFIRLVEIGA